VTIRHEARYQRVLNRLSMTRWIEVRMRASKGLKAPHQILAKQCHILGIRARDAAAVAARMDTRP
jgi:hypothetical protein